jgi:hypothetical protein
VCTALAGDFKLALGDFTLDSIGTAAFGCAILYHLLDGRMTRTRTP